MKEIERGDNMRTDGKIDYKRARVLKGHAPHKLFKMAIKGYEAKLKQEEELKAKEVDAFDINRIGWKGLE
jgi:hypothetical protein